MKLKKKTISKILIIISSLVALTLLIFVVLSINFLAPVDKKSEEVIEFNVPTGMGKNQIADEMLYSLSFMLNLIQIKNFMLEHTTFPKA